MYLRHKLSFLMDSLTINTDILTGQPGNQTFSRNSQNGIWEEMHTEKHL